MLTQFDLTKRFTHGLVIKFIHFQTYQTSYRQWYHRQIYPSKLEHSSPKVLRKKAM